jgi:hypothetical protein
MPAMSTEPQIEPSESLYQAPRVEAILTADELAREIHYAGIGASDPG